MPEDSRSSRWHTTPELWAKLKPLARQRRKEPTLAEKKLWEKIRGKQILSFKFRRQHPLERFIVDFYCHDAKLIIEVDGQSHDYTQEEDQVRQEFLEGLGFEVIRFSNEDVLLKMEAVLGEIARVLISET